MSRKICLSSVLMAMVFTAPGFAKGDSVEFDLGKQVIPEVVIQPLRAIGVVTDDLTNKPLRKILVCFSIDKANCLEGDESKNASTITGATGKVNISTKKKGTFYILRGICFV